MPRHQHYNFDQPDSAGTCNVVLGLAVPRNVQELPRTPPPCYAMEGDRAAVELLRGFGIGLDIDEAEINQACHLASGYSDIIFILERPRAKRYDTTFEDFVQSSDTLCALDGLIRFASKGSRSIETVTVLDAFSFQPDKNNHDFDRECHRILSQIIRIKKPKVIVRCHRDSYEDLWMKRFELPGEGYRLERSVVDIEETHSAVVFQSFHPSCAIHNAWYRPEYRALLIHHVIATFGELHGQGELPAYVEDVRLLCNVRGHRVRNDMPFDSPYMAALYTRNTLSAQYEGPGESRPVEFACMDHVERMESRALAFSNMYWKLRGLAQGTFNPGALALGRTRFFNWGGDFFQEDPLFRQISWLLRARGLEQEGWIAPSSNHTDEAPVPPSIRTTLSRRQPFNIPDECLNDKRQELVLKIKKVAKLTGSRLLASNVTELAESLRVASVLAYYGEFLKGFDRKGYILGNDGNGSLRMDVAFCQHCLENLEGLTRPTTSISAVQETHLGTFILTDRLRRTKLVN